MQISLLILATVAVVCLAKIPDNYERVPGHGLYRYSQRKMTWNAAKAECERDGATLLVLNSPAEAAALKQLFSRRRSPGDGIFAHVGFQDQDTEGVYRTVQGGTLDSAGYNVWKYRPTGSSSNQRNDCGGMIICGRLTDMQCEQAAPFICEFPTVQESAESIEEVGLEV